MTRPTIEERLLGLIERADELAAGFLHLDSDVRALAKDLNAELAEVRRQAKVAARLEIEGTPAARLPRTIPLSKRT